MEKGIEKTYFQFGVSQSNDAGRSPSGDPTSARIPGAFAAATPHQRSVLTCSARNKIELVDSLCSAMSPLEPRRTATLEGKTTPLLLDAFRRLKIGTEAGGLAKISHTPRHKCKFYFAPQFKTFNLPLHLSPLIVEDHDISYLSNAFS